MAVNQSDQISTVPASFSNSDSAKHTQKTITVMKLHVNPFNNSSVNVSTSSNTESCNENSHVSNSTVRNLDDQSSNVKLITIKQADICDLIKGENLQQLSTNALPPYSPGSPPKFIQPDIKTFDINCCTDCGDTFALKSSLNFHLERRSVLIKFPCETCKNTCIFYNRCNLLSHIRSHIDKSEKADIGKAVVTVLPRVFMDGIQNEFVNNLDDELNTIEDNDVLPPSEMLECSLHELEGSVISPKQIETETEIRIFKVKCLDCNEEFESANERKEHLTNGDKIPVPMSQCNKCGLVCPSKCSLKAHQRIHLQISPYVCPECGDSPDPHWNNFLNHVNFQCFHNTRSVGYKCPVCKRVSPTNDSLLKHMELHTEKYAKCSECPRAYNSTQAFKAHNNIYHDGVAVQYTMIFKCSLCDIVFVSNDQMLSHRSTHLKEQVCEYVFNCMQCGKPLESKVLLEEHIRNTHPKIYKQNHQNEQNASKSAVASPVTYRGNVECILCNCIFYSHQGYSVHVSRAHININQICACCSKVIPNRKEMIKHGRLHLHEKHFVCLLCNNKKFNSTVELDVHLDDCHIRKLKFCSFCPVCNRLFPNLPQALNHLREEHFLPIKTETSSGQHESCTVNPFPNTMCHFCRDTFVSNLELQTHLKNEHNIDAKSNRSDDLRSTEQSFKKQQIIGNTCAKCQFQSGVREDFKKHILSHKTNQSTFQCQECGLCFVVQPSLTKHLRIVHKISDPLKYIKDEGTNYVPERENQTEISKRSALECSVCFTSFPNETSLKTHMRSHGMAFIQANKSDYYSRKLEKLKQCTESPIEGVSSKVGEVQNKRKCLIHLNSDKVLPPSPNTAFCKEVICEKTPLPKDHHSRDLKKLKQCTEISIESVGSKEGKVQNKKENLLIHSNLDEVLPPSPHTALCKETISEKTSISEGDYLSDNEDLNACMAISMESTNSEGDKGQDVGDFLQNLGLDKASVTTKKLPASPNVSLNQKAVNKEMPISKDDCTNNIEDLNIQIYVQKYIWKQASANICMEISMEDESAEEQNRKNFLKNLDSLSAKELIYIPSERLSPCNTGLYKETVDEERSESKDNFLKDLEESKQYTETPIESTNYIGEEIQNKTKNLKHLNSAEMLPSSPSEALDKEAVIEKTSVSKDDNSGCNKKMCTEISMEGTDVEDQNIKNIIKPLDCEEEKSIPKEVFPPSPSSTLHKEAISIGRSVNEDDLSSGNKEMCTEVSIEVTGAESQNSKIIVNHINCDKESIPKEIFPSPHITALHKEAIAVERLTDEDDYSSDSEGLDACMISFENTDSEGEEKQNTEQFLNSLGISTKLISSKVLPPSPDTLLEKETTNEKIFKAKEVEKPEDADLFILPGGGGDDNSIGDCSRSIERLKQFNEISIENTSFGGKEKQIRREIIRTLNSSKELIIKKVPPHSSAKTLLKGLVHKKTVISKDDYTKNIEKLKYCTEISIESTDYEEDFHKRRKSLSDSQSISGNVLPSSFNAALHKKVVSEKASISKDDYAKSIEKLKQRTDISIKTAISEGEAIKNGGESLKQDSDKQLIPRFQDLFSNKLNQLLGRIDVLEKKTESMCKGSGARKISLIPSNDLVKYFPITSDEKLIEFEKILSEEDSMKALVATLMEIKGTGVINVVAAIMKRVLSDDVAELYSWAGRKDRKMFEGLNLAKGIFEVVHLHFPKETENSVGNVIGHWLRNAKLRRERMKMTKGKSKLKKALISNDESSN